MSNSVFVRLRLQGYGKTIKGMTGIHCRVRGVIKQAVERLCGLLCVRACVRFTLPILKHKQASQQLCLKISLVKEYKIQNKQMNFLTLR